jgi:hypothetical protein
MNDPIVDEVRRIRDAHAARFDYDLDAIFRDVKEQEQKSGRKFVSFAATRAEQAGVPKALVDATVRALGDSYADGTPQLEINLPIDRAAPLPFKKGERVPISLRIAGKEYRAGLRATRRHKKVWVSPDVYASGGERLTLGRLLTDAGFRANDPVRLVVNGSAVEVQALRD